jgi:hypothetical protein
MIPATDTWDVPTFVGRPRRHGKLIMVDTTTAAPKKTTPEPPFVFELANNAVGDIEHGRRVAAELGAWPREFDLSFAFDPRFRERGAFAHPAFEALAGMKSINHFSEARLRACASAQPRGGLRGLMPLMPSTGASKEEPFQCSHPRCFAACFSPWSLSP